MKTNGLMQAKHFVCLMEGATEVQSIMMIIIYTLTYTYLFLYSSTLFVSVLASSDTEQEIVGVRRGFPGCFFQCVMQTVAEVSLLGWCEHAEVGCPRVVCGQQMRRGKPSVEEGAQLRGGESPDG